MESRLLECLEIVSNPGGRKKYKKSAEFKLLEKPWKGLLLAALENQTGRENVAKRTPRSRRLRGRSRNRDPWEDWIERVDNIAISEAPPGYRLATMLVQRAILGERWNQRWDSTLENIRQTCHTEGLHPVWSKLASEAPILAELTSYPECAIKQTKKGNRINWLEGARIDPLDNQAIARWLQSPTPFSFTSEVELSIQSLARKYGSNGRIKQLPSAVMKLNGESTLIRAILQYSINPQEAMIDLKKLCEIDDDISTVAEDQLALARLRHEEIDAWDACRSAEGNNSLSIAMRREAWNSVPNNRILSSSEIEVGLNHIDGAENSNALQWALISALCREQEFEKSISIASGLKVTDPSHLPLLLELLSETQCFEIESEITCSIQRYNDAELLEIMLSKSAAPLREAAAVTLQSRESELCFNNLETALELIYQQGDTKLIGSILMGMENSAENHPHQTIMVHHLLPADADNELKNWILNARQTAISTLTQETEGTLSPATISLIKILEGTPVDIGPVHALLDRSGIQALNQCRRALMDDGDGLVSEDLLNLLQESIESASMNMQEERLFDAVLTHLRFNRTIRLLESEDDEDIKQAEETLDNLIYSSPRMRVVDDAHQAVLEHGIALPALSEWHRAHSPSTGWHLIVLASINSKEGKTLQAARGYRRASQMNVFGYEDQVRIARRALIAFAHAGRWAEAVEMLENQPALQSAITNKFQLYLHVCDDQNRGQSSSAVERLLKSIAKTEQYETENVNGEKITKRRTIHSSDELDALYTYPNKYGLPIEPWQGRVRASINGLKENRRSPMSLLQARFRNTLLDKGTVSEIEGIANDAAALDPTLGLMMFERAINSRLFSLNEMKALQRSQQAIFSLNQEEIPIRIRRNIRHLQNVKPLVLVDTNILIDAAKERIGNLLNSEGLLGGQPNGSFYRTILSRAKNMQLYLLIPKVAILEFKNRTNDIKKVRQLFSNVWIDEINWNSKVDQNTIFKIISEVISDYSTWVPPPSSKINNSDSIADEQVHDFLLAQSDIYHQITEFKSDSNPNTPSGRTLLSGKKIYPESGDCAIMSVATLLANESTQGIGSVLIATRDSDFTMVRRKLEDEVGCGVVRNARELSQWI